MTSERYGTGPLEITGLDNHSEALAAIYTDSEMMLAWLQAPASLRDKLTRALRCQGTAADMRGRFGVETIPQDVKDAIDAFITACVVASEPVKARVLALRAEGYEWSTTWRLLEDAQGFGYGDAQLLGIGRSACGFDWNPATR